MCSAIVPFPAKCMGRHDFFFNNIYHDPFPWFSHQHDVSIESGGSGVWTIL